jgi:titin
LIWADKAKDETGFVIERRISGGEFGPLASLPANTTHYTDVTLEAGKTYIYRVAASGKVGASDWLEARIALTPPAEPRGMLASSPSDKKINLTWTDRSSNETGFLLERKTSAPKAEFEEIAKGIFTNVFRDTNVVPGTVYTYRVRA